MDTKTFLVSAKFTSYCDVEIEAENLDEAKEIAYNLDSEKFQHSGYGDWNIDEITEIKGE